MTASSTRDEPTEDLRAFAEAAPDLPSAWIKLASALEESGAVPEAIEAWKTAFLLVPNSRRILEAVDRLGVEIDVPAKTAAPPAKAGASASEAAATVESQEEAEPESGSAGLDIDTLISDLQSGRSKPTVEFDEPERSRVEDARAEGLVSETLAKIYESQNHLAEAAEMYEILAVRATDTERAGAWRARAAELRKRTTSRG